MCFDIPELSASMMVDSSAESAGPGEGVRRVNADNKKMLLEKIPTFESIYVYVQEGNKLSPKEVEKGSLGVGGSLGSGFSIFERDTDLRMTGVSSGKDFSIAMTGASFDRDT